MDDLPGWAGAVTATRCGRHGAGAAHLAVLAGLRRAGDHQVTCRPAPRHVFAVAAAAVAPPPTCVPLFPSTLPAATPLPRKDRSYGLANCAGRSVVPPSCAPPFLHLRSFSSQAYTVGSPAAHLFSLLTSPSTPFRVAVTRLPRGATRDAAAVHRAVATAGRLPPLRVGVDARRRFGVHWASTARGGTPRAAAAAAATAAAVATTTAAGRGGGDRDGSARWTAASAVEAARPRKRR